VERAVGVSRMVRTAPWWWLGVERPQRRAPLGRPQEPPHPHEPGVVARHGELPHDVHAVRLLGGQEVALEMLDERRGGARSQRVAAQLDELLPVPLTSHRLSVPGLRRRERRHGSPVGPAGASATVAPRVWR
jgi:hypothetical protein